LPQPFFLTGKKSELEEERTNFCPTLNILLGNMAIMHKFAMRHSLSFALLIYLMSIIVLVTLLPFRFAWPDRLQIIFLDNIFDVIANVGLFLPLGFLYRLHQARQDDRCCLRPLCFGLLTSLSIEMIQLLMPGRYSSPVDILVNGSGVWIGAMLYHRTQHRLYRHMVKQLVLEIPLMHLFYLLLPLLWLNSATIDTDVSRLWLLPLVGLCGAIALTASWVRRLQPSSGWPPSMLMLTVVLWFAVGVLPAWPKHPGFLLLCGIGLLLTTHLLRRLPWAGHENERRFETHALSRIWPFYMTYLILLMLCPWPWRPQAWRASVGFATLIDIPGVIPTLRVVTEMAAFTLFGYMGAESRGRQNETLRRTAWWLLAYSLLVAGGLEGLRGFHPQHSASLAHVTLATAITLYGGIIYRLQLTSVQRLLAHAQSAATTP
jgi:VanZ family protein